MERPGLKVLETGGNYLDLLKRDFEAKGLVVVRVEGVLLDCRLLLLQPLAVLHQVNLHVGICGGKGKRVKDKMTRLLVLPRSWSGLCPLWPPETLSCASGWRRRRADDELLNHGTL